MKRKQRNSYKADLLADLQDPAYAADYLSASMDESVETFLLALRDVADARKGIRKVASDAHVNRENLYRMLSGSGNPTLNNLHAVLNALGLRIVVESVSRKSQRLEARQREGVVVLTDATVLKETFGESGIVSSHWNTTKIPDCYAGGTQPRVEAVEAEELSTVTM